MALDKPAALLPLAGLCSCLWQGITMMTEAVLSMVGV